MGKNIEFTSKGLKCDNEKCDWKDETIQFEDFDQWLNKPCPKCGENLLTQEDYNNSMLMLDVVNFINSLSKEELIEYNKKIDMEKLKQTDLLKDAEGLELLDESKEEGNYTMTIIDINKGIKVSKIEKM